MAQYSTIDNVVANAYTICEGATDADHMFMRQWAFLGNKELGYSKEDMRTEKVYVTDLALAKPEDLVYTESVTLYDNKGQIVKTQFVGYGQHVRKRNENNIIVNKSGYYTLTEDASHFHLSSDAQGIGTYAMIRYYGIPQDENGDPMILERKRYALMLFIRYMWALRINRNQAEIQMSQQTWLMEARKQRAKNKMPTIEEANSISRWYMNLITVPSPIKY